MTINTENPSKMVLRDNKRNAFIGAGGIVLVGLLIAVLLIRHGVFPIFFGLIFVGAGAFFLLRLRRVTIELDKAAGNVHILLEGLKSKEERNLQMTEVKQLLMRKVIHTFTTQSNTRTGSTINRTTTRTTYHQFILVFVTAQNEEIAFEFGRVRLGLLSILTSPEEKIRRNAQSVADFLNVPLTEAGPPSAAQALGALRQGFAARLQKVH